ncbi:hypothetical protein KKF84_08830, partial [Myxococcota bacterium]|nr:hypothetical protein [Myxococcota bacterium]
SVGTLASHQFLVVGSAALIATVTSGAPTIPIPGTSDLIQNGSPDGIALVDTISGTLVDSLSYEGSMTSVTIADVGTVNLVSGTPTTVEDSNAVAGSLVRYPDGSNTDDDATDWAFSTTITPGAPNVQ